MIDTNALIALKTTIPVNDQWNALVQMTSLVSTGHLAFPREVAAELKVARHPDAPGAWAAGNKGWAWHHQPADDSLAEVLAVAQLTDPTSEADTEVADPYVVAMAWQIRDRSPATRVIVVTEDRIDRMPAKESVVTACDRLGIECCSAAEFSAWLRDQPV